MAVLIASAGLALRLDLSTLSVIDLLIAASFAAYCGPWQASVFALSAVASFASFYGLPATIRDVATPHSVIAMAAFALTLLVVSHVSTREKKSAAEIRIQRHRTQRLHAVSHNVLLLNSHESAEKQIAEFIQQEFELDAVAIVSNSPAPTGTAGLWALAESEEWLRSVSDEPSQSAGISRRPLLSSTGPLGTLFILGDVPLIVLDSLASLSSLALERHRACLNEEAADAARLTEELRTTVLDGLAHAIKTPLTIIRAASSGLLITGHLDDRQQQLTQMIDEHAEQIDEMTNRLLGTARLDGDKIHLQLETIDFPSLIHEVVQEFGSEDPIPSDNLNVSPTITTHIAEGTQPIAADYEMMASTLKELLNNAVKYSTIGSPINLSLAGTASELTLSVQNRGPLIGVEDHDRIFERFYRGRDHRHAAQGTGIGLSVARKVTEAHGGRIWVTSNEDEGTIFFISLPTQRASVANTGGL
ncbi:MAG: ATP-binding protein [Acidobacteriaceae bacterium]